MGPLLPYCIGQNSHRSSQIPGLGEGTPPPEGGRSHLHCEACGCGERWFIRGHCDNPHSNTERCLGHGIPGLCPLTPVPCHPPGGFLHSNSLLWAPRDLFSPWGSFLSLGSLQVGLFWLGSVWTKSESWSQPALGGNMAPRLTQLCDLRPADRSVCLSCISCPVNKDAEAWPYQVAVKKEWDISGQVPNTEPAWHWRVASKYWPRSPSIPHRSHFSAWGTPVCFSMAHSLTSFPASP